MAKTIITLGREYCTGGRYIAEDVANALGIKLYDKELITMAAKHSGLSEEAVAASEKRHTHSLLYSLYTMGNELPLGDQVFILQSRIIKQLAEEGPCVILGRCGDYVLRERKDVLRVFVYAPKEWRHCRRAELRAKIKACEDEMEACGAREVELDNEINSPEVYNDPDLLRQKSDELSDLRFHQEELFAAWEAAMEEQESYEQSQQTEE